MKLEQTNRIIIKIGSALLFNDTSGSLNKEWLNSLAEDCLLYTSPSPRDATLSRMPSSA